MGYETVVAKWKHDDPAVEKVTLKPMVNTNLRNPITRNTQTMIRKKKPGSLLQNHMKNRTTDAWCNGTRSSIKRSRLGCFSFPRKFQKKRSTHTLIFFLVFQGSCTKHDFLCEESYGETLTFVHARLFYRGNSNREKETRKKKCFEWIELRTVRSALKLNCHKNIFYPYLYVSLINRGSPQRFYMRACALTRVFKRTFGFFKHFQKDFSAEHRFSFEEFLSCLWNMSVRRPLPLSR